MKQLGTLDSAFINLERNNTPQHIGGLGIYDPSSAPNGSVRFKEVLANFEQRLSKFPMFRTRLVPVPGDIDRPYWVEDSNFDVEFHIRHISLPKPGDWRQLWIQAARLHSRPLDMSRPLWEVYVIEGLDEIPGLPVGAFAIYTKMHHSLVDGAGGASFMAAIHDLVPNPPADTSPLEAIVVDREPTSAELLGRAVWNQTTGGFGRARTMGKAVFELAKYGLAVSREKIPSPDITAPPSRFNQNVGPHRVAEAAMFDLADFKLIKNAVGVTVNDVALSVIGGGIRRYLQKHNDLPEDSLVASIPMDMRTRGGKSEENSQDNNQVGSTFTELHTNIADPVERLLAVQASTKVAKESGASNPMAEAMRVAGFFSPAVSKTVSRLWAENQWSKYLPVNTSTVVTNVPGPDFPMYCAGAEMVRYHGLGLLTPGCGSFHTVFSSSGKIGITLLADRAIVPDPEFYRECLEASFEETFAATVTTVAKNEKKKAKRAPAKAKARRKKAAA